MAFILPLLSFFGSTVSSFFGWKKEQAHVVSQGLGTLGDLAASTSLGEQARAAIIAAEASSSNVVTSSWRPIMMYLFMGIIVSFWFGYTPPHLIQDMPAIVGRIFDIVEIGIMGYIPARSIEKIVATLNLGPIIKTLIQKKLT